jgi:predicted RNA-binding Zn-ribbon protein involved in translation (DUF1610 family)
MDKIPKPIRVYADIAEEKVVVAYITCPKCTNVLRAPDVKFSPLADIMKGAAVTFNCVRCGEPLEVRKSEITKVQLQAQMRKGPVTLK